MSIADIKQNAELKMAKSIEAYKNELVKIRVGRAHPGILDQVNVDYYGSMVPISQVANVTLLDARTISVQPWEKGMGAKIEKAIRESDLGLNPASMGDLIRVPMPIMTEERRRELTKVVRGEGESAKVAIRNLRRDANEALKKLLKDKAISEDDEKHALDDVQKLTDEFIEKLWTAAGVDVPKAKAFADSDASMAPIELAQKEAEKYGVVSTPTFLIGETGKPLTKFDVNLDDAEAFKAAFDELLKP